MFKEFVVADVFGKSFLGKYHNPNDLVFDAAGHPYICASNSNNGINKDMPRVTGKTLSLTPDRIIAWGKQCPMFCYHDEPCVTSQGMYYLDMTDYDERVCLYVCGALTKSCANKYSYTNCLIGKILDAEIISLPVVEHPDPNHVYTADDIDWDYMRERITELERERITELERERITELNAYLQAAGLNDYELTIEEEMALKGFFDESVSFKKFRVDELFAPELGDTDIQKSDINGIGIPVVSSGVGIRGVIGCSDIKAKVINTPSITVDMFGNAFYRDEPFKMVTHARVFALVPLSMTLDRQLGEFFESQIKKICSGFDYNNMCSFAKIRDKEIKVPVNPDGSINFAYIYIYERWRRKQSRKLCNARKD